MRTDTLFVTADKVHSHKPLTQGYLGVLKDSADLLAEILVALGTAEPAVSTFMTVVLTAVGANNILLVTDSPTGINDCLTAFVLGAEINSNRIKGVEFAEINHNPLVLCLHLTYSNLWKHNTMELC